MFCPEPPKKPPDVFTAFTETPLFLLEIKPLFFQCLYAFLTGNHGDLLIPLPPLPQNAPSRYKHQTETKAKV